MLIKRQGNVQNFAGNSSRVLVAVLFKFCNKVSVARRIFRLALS